MSCVDGWLECDWNDEFGRGWLGGEGVGCTSYIIARTYAFVVISRSTVRSGGGLASISHHHHHSPQHSTTRSHDSPLRARIALCHCNSNAAARLAGCSALRDTNQNPHSPRACRLRARRYRHSNILTKLRDHEARTCPIRKEQPRTWRIRARCSVANQKNPSTLVPSSDSLLSLYFNFWGIPWLISWREWFIPGDSAREYDSAFWWGNQVKKMVGRCVAWLMPIGMTNHRHSSMPARVPMHCSYS